MEVLLATGLGSVLVDLETEEIELVDDEPPPCETADVSLPLLIAAARSGARVAAVVDRRPPVLLSDDTGLTWREAGGGLPAGTAIAIHPDDPDHMVFASESRLYVSRDGGLFWQVLTPELIRITSVAFA
jgi:hypothetical protein